MAATKSPAAPARAPPRTSASSPFLGDDLERARSVASLGVVVDEASFRLGIDVPAGEWGVVQAYEKPFISLPWLGTIVLGAGFVVSFGRRVSEQKR